LHSDDTVGDQSAPAPAQDDITRFYFRRGYRLHRNSVSITDRRMHASSASPKTDTTAKPQQLSSEAEKQLA
jgi:hypothetical protein